MKRFEVMVKANRAERSSLLQQDETDIESLMAMATHELREPAQAIHGLLSVVLAERAGPLTEVQRDFLSTANQASRRMGRLINDLLLLATEVESFSVQPEQVNLIEHIATSFDELRPLTESLETRFEVCGEKVGSTFLQADPTRLEQILINLLENAVRYGEPGSVVQVRVRDSGSRVLCVVSNETAQASEEGDGDGFHRDVDLSLRRHEHSGSGLGLKIVDMMVKAHGGRLICRTCDDRIEVGFLLPKNC